MNWRQDLPPWGTDHRAWYYSANESLFSNFTEFFAYLKEHKLRTYFNDHPWPVAQRGAGGLQTSPEEVRFRWNGLADWMDRGLTFWWYDLNWGFSIPPPFVNTSSTSVLQTPVGEWDGLSNAEWGSHLYFSVAKYFDENVRDKHGDDWYGGRPMTLSKFALFQGHDGWQDTMYAAHSAQHRYPVWWSGDGVNLKTSVSTMVDGGVHHLKPFVHSDCGGDSRGSAGDLMRWVAHCAYGTILRIHGADHRAWTYDDHTVDVIRSYLNARYQLAPSLIAAGRRATDTGFPLVARGDLYWPEHAESASNLQYIFLDDMLVAPIVDSATNETQRSVWIPPGEWEDAWDGSLVTGLKTINVRRPYEQMPLWHRRGGLLILAPEPTAPVDDQDWSTLVLEAFPAASGSTRRSLFERRGSGRTDLQLSRDGDRLHLRIGTGGPRNWLLRLHLRPAEHATAATVDGIHVAQLSHIAPARHSGGPLKGARSAPPSGAGPVVEISVATAGHARSVEVQIGKSVELSV